VNKKMTIEYRLNFYIPFVSKTCRNNSSQLSCKDSRNTERKAK